MTSSRSFRTLLSLSLLVSLTGISRADGGSDPVAPAVHTGSLHGIAKDGHGERQANAYLSVCRMVDFTCAKLHTDDNGSFLITALQPGLYQVSAVTPGPDAKAVVGEVVAGGDTTADVLLQAAAPAAPAVPATPPNNSFMHRLGRAYVADWAGNGPATAVASEVNETRRGTPAPLFSPPYPAADWPIGGSVVIGAPDGQTYPFMQAVNENKGVNKIYGWLEVGGNGTTNNKGRAVGGANSITANAPAAYDVYPNVVQLDQAAVYFERLEDTAQRQHFDWGYRVTLLYGTDYRFTTSHGLLSQQLLVKNAQYGFDPVMFYYDAYFPKVAQGLIVRVGRYISLPDIEAQLAPNNYTYSHSILYTYDCYTQLGVNGTLKVNDHLTVQAGLSASCDTMPWTSDAKATGNVCFTYTWHNGGDALNTCDNTINDGKYAYNNLTAFYETWYHRFNKSWHTDTEAWYQYMKGVPNMYWYDNGIANTAKTPWPETNGAGVNLNFGAVCQNPNAPAAQQQSRCYAPEWAIVNYVEHNFWNNTASLNIRNEYVNDIKGQRSGTPTVYEEHMVGLDLWSGSTITFRPEVSFTKCYSKYTSINGKAISCTDISPGASVANAYQYYSNPGAYTGPNPTATLSPLGQGKTATITVAGDLIFHF